ncbi:fatty acyl-CoA reductase 1-like [Chrysoperla carnea]|uniref:fatty acyl-CoA reductase 1-like n=1 Tax=Chrysoperla carnea TaxID=189513 RepID=UPI001D0853AA|nr:fatty acyl-CoA reductase 1-like [Chrysoperla carnea]
MIDNRNYSIDGNDNILIPKKKVHSDKVTLSQLSNNLPSISEFYADQNIFITGGTGFMGKVLIEKLLRSCPKIKGIYLLLRSKKNYTDDQRFFMSKMIGFEEKVTLSQLSNNLPSISEFYADQNIFITGGTGFMGKVLIEKLLRSCPKIKAIYLLLRSKKNYADDQRLNKIFNAPLFDRLKEEYPESLSKVKVIKGDVSKIKFGLSDLDMKLIINEMNIVFHVAASVRFDDPLKDAILINTRGTREMLRIVKQMKKLKVFLYTSTTYCNVDKETEEIEEKIYEATTNWETMIKAAENMDQNVLNFIEQKILDKYPNTYTFTKNLAEAIVSEYCEDIPTVIFRPAVVLGTEYEPMPGWIDNFNGPMGLVTGIMVGLLHTVYIDGDKRVDWISVDRVINGMIISIWYKAFEEIERKKCLVINSSTSDLIQVYNREIFNHGLSAVMKNPPTQLLWYPFCFYTKFKYLYWFYFVTLHLIPAIFLSFLLKLTNQSLDLFKLYRRIFYSNMKLAPFTLNEWAFKNDNFRSLQAILKPEDTQKFSIDYSQVVVEDAFDIGALGSNRYLLKDKNFTKETLNKRIFNYKIKFYLHVMLIGFLIISSFFVMNLWYGITYKRYI